MFGTKHLNGLMCGPEKQKGVNPVLFFISSFRRVLYVVFFLLRNYPAYEFYMPTFRNTLSVPS